MPTNCLNVFDHFVGLALKGLILNMFLFNPLGISIFLYANPILFSATITSKYWKAFEESEIVRKGHVVYLLEKFSNNSLVCIVIDATLEVTVAAGRRCSVKKLFWEISQIHRKNVLLDSLS